MANSIGNPSFSEYYTQYQPPSYSTQPHIQVQSERNIWSMTRRAGRFQERQIRELKSSCNHKIIGRVIGVIVGVALLALGSLATYVSILAPAPDKTPLFAISAALCGLGVTCVYFGFNEAIVFRNIRRVVDNVSDYITEIDGEHQLDPARYRAALLKGTVAFGLFINKYIPYELRE